MGSNYDSSMLLSFGEILFSCTFRRKRWAQRASLLPGFVVGSLFCFDHKVIKNAASHFLKASSSAPLSLPSGPLLPFPLLSMSCLLRFLLWAFSSGVQSSVLEEYSGLSLLRGCRVIAAGYSGTLSPSCRPLYSLWITVCKTPSSFSCHP